MKTQKERLSAGYDIIFSIIALVAVYLAIYDIAIGCTHIQHYIDIMINILFIIDYGIRLLLAKDKKNFFRSNIFDLIAIIPFNSLFSVLKRPLASTNSPDRAIAAALQNAAITDIHFLLFINQVPPESLSTLLILTFTPFKIKTGLHIKEPSVSEHSRLIQKVLCNVLCNCKKLTNQWVLIGKSFHQCLCFFLMIPAFQH